MSGEYLKKINSATHQILIAKLNTKAGIAEMIMLSSSFSPFQTLMVYYIPRSRFYFFFIYQICGHYSWISCISFDIVVAATRQIIHKIIRKVLFKLFFRQDNLVNKLYYHRKGKTEIAGMDCSFSKSQSRIVFFPLLIL